MADKMCETECREDLIKQVGMKLDRRFFWTIIGGIIGASFIVVMGLFGYSVNASDKKDGEQDKRIHEFELVQKKIERNQAVIQRDIELIRDSIEKEAMRNEKTQDKILEKLEALSK